MGWVVNLVVLSWARLFAVFCLVGLLPGLMEVSEPLPLATSNYCADYQSDLSVECIVEPAGSNNTMIIGGAVSREPGPWLNAFGGGRSPAVGSQGEGVRTPLLATGSITDLIVRLDQYGGMNANSCDGDAVRLALMKNGQESELAVEWHPPSSTRGMKLTSTAPVQILPGDDIALRVVDACGPMDVDLWLGWSLRFQMGAISALDPLLCTSSGEIIAEEICSDGETSKPFSLRSNSPLPSSVNSMIIGGAADNVQGPWFNAMGGGGWTWNADGTRELRTPLPMAGTITDLIVRLGSANGGTWNEPCDGGEVRFVLMKNGSPTDLFVEWDPGPNSGGEKRLAFGNVHIEPQDDIALRASDECGSFEGLFNLSWSMRFWIGQEQDTLALPCTIESKDGDGPDCRRIWGNQSDRRLIIGGAVNRGVGPWINAMGGGGWTWSRDGVREPRTPIIETGTISDLLVRLDSHGGVSKNACDGGEVRLALMKNGQETDLAVEWRPSPELQGQKLIAAGNISIHPGDDIALRASDACGPIEAYLFLGWSMTLLVE